MTRSRKYVIESWRDIGIKKSDPDLPHALNRVLARDAEKPYEELVSLLQLAVAPGIALRRAQADGIQPYDAARNYASAMVRDLLDEGVLTVDSHYNISWTTNRSVLSATSAGANLDSAGALPTQP